MDTQGGGKTGRPNAGGGQSAFGFIQDMSVRITPDGIVGWAVGSGGLLLKLVPAAEFAAAVSSGTPEVVLSGAPDGVPRSDLPLTFMWRRLGEFTCGAL